MRSNFLNTTARPVLAAAAVLAAGALLSCNSSIFYVEADEPRLCKEVDGIGPFPGVVGGFSSTVTNDFDIPIGDAIPTFSASKGDLRFSLLDLTFTRGAGLPDFKDFEAAKLTLLPPDGSGMPPLDLVTYTQAPLPDPNSILLQGDPTLNIAPYLFGGGKLSVHAEITGKFPSNSWSVNVTPCLSTRIHVNYANLFLPDAGS